MAIIRTSVPTKTPRIKKEKPKKLASKCLLLKTPDNRCFFTEEKHFPCLIEFGRTFEAEISVVKMKEQVEVLDLGDLAKSICTPSTTEIVPDYEIVETKLVATLKKNSEVRISNLEQGKLVLEYVQSILLAGHLVCAGDLESKFPTINKVKLYSHFTRARREMTAQGHTLKKEKPGTYRLVAKQD